MNEQHKYIVYDLTCLISQQVSGTPTGTVRVDLSYADYLLTKHSDQSIFVRQLGAHLVVVDTNDVNDLIQHLKQSWNCEIPGDTTNQVNQNNLEFRIKYHGLWDPDYDTFFSMPFRDRFNYLLNQELTDIFGTEFKWVGSLSIFPKIIYSVVASLGRLPAKLLLRAGQFIGVLLYTHSFKAALKFVTITSKQVLTLDNWIRNNKSSLPDSRYLYFYTAYNRGFPFEALDALDKLVPLDLVIFIHDLIIIYYPEYFLPVSHNTQKSWLKRLLSLQPYIIANSNTTKVFVERFADEYHRRLKPILISHIGVEPLFKKVVQQVSGNIKPYFVVVSTIEPRKNHLLLLNIWREIVLGGLCPIPDLYIVGKRGWENENVIDMLQRCSTIQDHIHEVTDKSDNDLILLLAGSRALLYPSFCEGWGMPVVEALSLGVPVICSDIPELRESGQNMADYLSPLDGIGWKNAICNYCDPDSQMRQDQLERIKHFVPPEWEDHFSLIRREFIDNA